jgi:hypothetical protein
MQPYRMIQLLGNKGSINPLLVEKIRYYPGTKEVKRSIDYGAEAVVGVSDDSSLRLDFVSGKSEVLQGEEATQVHHLMNEMELGNDELRAKIRNLLK